MKPLAKTLALLALVAGASGSAAYWLTARAAVPACERCDALSWVRTEFGLTEPQTRAIEDLHNAHQEVCARHCADIAQVRRSLAEAQRRGAGESELAQLQELEARIDAECRASIRAHAEQVAAVIGGSEGRRYLATVLPRLHIFDHEAPPNLSLQPKPPAHAPGGG
jgi:hypothetical protein